MNLGLDIGRQFVKAVLLEKNRGGTKIVNTGIRLIPDQNKTYDPESITKPMWVMAIRELMREMSINPKRVKSLVSSLNGTSVSVKQITTMDMPEDELFSSMTFEARKHIPMDGSDAVIDFQVFGPNPKEVDKIDIGLVACTKKVSNSHLELLKEIGFSPGIIDADPIALSNAFANLSEFPEEGAVVLLDIGSVSSSLVVWGRKDQFFTRDIPIGGYHFVSSLAEKLDIDYVSAEDKMMKDGINSFQNNIDSDLDNISVAEKNVFDNLVEDVRRSLRYYAKTTNQSFFTKIMISGGGASTQGLKEMIEQKLSLNTELFNPFQSLAGFENIDISNPEQYAVSTGLAVRGLLEE
ncbi:MAG: type IV pilus assembly protein PilM [Candidatus Neomarinimicrobiota bacterium]|mgnify:FL=1|nr:MAG: type IV pilus assembly protein PilM [bacterium]|tara:strand:- start:6037 stop:7089 length:1053 start_codon:yes stop_codon:yes gene_type:complete